MNLFQQGDFTLHSGKKSSWKIDCDALTDEDWATLARIAATEYLGPFGSVEGVPQGGLKFAEALRKYITPGCPMVLVADDVLTTGRSMIEQAGHRANVAGVVVFSRSSSFVLPWVLALFTMPKDFDATS